MAMTYEEVQNKWDRLTATVRKFNDLQKTYVADVPKRIVLQYNNCGHENMFDITAQPLIEQQLDIYAKRIETLCEELAIVRIPLQVYGWLNRERGDDE